MQRHPDEEMDPPRWARIEALCADALEQPPREREGWIARACGEDDALSREVLSLLRHAEADSAFLDTPVSDAASLSRLDPPEPSAGERIGPWQILGTLGRGGMGTVWLVEREADGIRQQGALKLVHRGMDSEEVLERFRLERRILGALNHPNIARLLDAAATNEGRPYFVMEHVDGAPVTEYADRENLPVAGRLDLMRTICAAVDHAHRHLVVHRDLKPRNIFVTQNGTVKLLDFGIGKVLGDSDALGPARTTRTVVRLLTPEYAAPEQLTGAPITTATDVYGLGLLLCELLTGRHPLLSGGESLTEMERAALQGIPTPPSRLLAGPSGSARRISRDLDLIVLKALRKEPERRYASAAELTEDLRRHLTGHPVSARPDTFGYRARRFLHRHAAWTAAAAVAVVALISITGVTLVQSRRVAAESARVASERDKALEVRGFLMEMFGATGASRAVGDTVTVRRLLDLQAARLDSEPWSPELRAEMQSVLADGYDRLGLFEEAESLAVRSLELRRTLLPASHPDLAASLNLAGWIAHERGRSRDAVSPMQDAIKIRRALGAAGERDLSRSLNDLGVVWNALGKYDSAQVVLEEALTLRDRLFGPAHRTVGITANNLAAAHWYQSHVAEAARVQGRAVSALRQSVGQDHQRTIIALSNLATFRVTAGDLDGAARDYRDLLGRQERLQGPDHPVTTQVRVSLATVLTQRPTRGGQDLDEAERHLRQALGAYETSLGPAHAQVGVTLDRLADLLLARGRPEEADPVARRAVDILTEKLGSDHRATADALVALAISHFRLGQGAEALTLLRRAVNGFRRAVGPEHPETGRAEGLLCEMLLNLGDDPAEAESHCASAEDALSQAPEGFRRLLPLVQLWRARAYYALGRTAAGDSIVAAVRTEVEEGAGGPEARRLLDSLYEAGGRR